MRKIFPLTLVLLLLFSSFSCTTKQEEQVPPPAEPVAEEITQEPEPVEPVLPEPEPSVTVLPEPEPEPLPPSEYSRSLGELNAAEISEETFEDDKEHILTIIAELNDIVRTKNYSKWLTYITPASKKYWTDPANLKVLSARMNLKKTMQLKDLRDYFEKFFIISRKGRVVDEIRYVTPDLVKAVQYKETEDIINYMFERTENGWLLNLDTNPDDSE